LKQLAMTRIVQLNVPDACHEDWNLMTPEEKGRYCMACRKTVLDFTNMSDREVLQHIAGTSGNVCGRMHSDQVNRNMMVQRERRLPWLKYFFQFTLPAIFVSLKTQAQDDKKPVVEQLQRMQKNAPDQLMPVSADANKFWVKGRVLAHDNTPLAYATVMVKGTGNHFSTDSNGNFSLSFSEGKKVILIFSYVGYGVKEIEMAPSTSETVTAVKMVQMEAFLQGVIVVTHVKRKPKRSALEVARSIITPDTVRVFPNPVGAGNDIQLQMQVKQPGNYSVEVSNFSGQMICQKQLQSDGKNIQSAINTKQLLPGTYIVCVRNDKGKSMGVKKIIVQ
jgi:hypothetical protein